MPRRNVPRRNTPRRNTKAPREGQGCHFFVFLLPFEIHCHFYFEELIALRNRVAQLCSCAFTQRDCAVVFCVNGVAQRGQKEEFNRGSHEGWKVVVCVGDKG